MRQVRFQVRRIPRVLGHALRSRKAQERLTFGFQRSQCGGN